MACFYSWTFFDASALQRGLTRRPSFPGLPVGSGVLNRLSKRPYVTNNLLVIELEAAVQRILTALPQPTGERVPLLTAAGRFLAGQVTAPVDLPPFDNSAMDGYAVRAGDLTGAGIDSPIPLRVIGKIPAGGDFGGEVHAGECVRLFTGSPMPRGADAVIMQEDTRPGSEGEVLMCDSVRVGESVRRRGDDVAAGSVIGRPGEALTPGRIALLAASGVSEVDAGRRPTVGLLATGSELREPGQPLGPGLIYESNRATLGPLIAQTGAVPRIYPLVPDTLPATCEALEAAFAQCDIVITSGGASVGELDFVKAAFEKLGGVLEFWKVAIRPGKPFVFGNYAGKYLFGLPGNPVSAFVTFLLLARPALLRWQGAAETGLRPRRATLATPLQNKGDRRHFIRVTLDARGNAFSAGKQASHALASLAGANGLVDLAAGESQPAGATVSVLEWH